MQVYWAGWIDLERFTMTIEILKILEQHIETDLKSLIETGYADGCIALNTALQNNVFCSNMIPNYFFGDLTANTVMVMLNPGDENPDFVFDEKNDRFFYDFPFELHSNNLSQLIMHYVKYYTTFGNYVYHMQPDNFELKQAAFLKHFPFSGIEITETFWEQKELRSAAAQNVINQKLQLELIPYASRKFDTLFRRKKDATSHLSIIKPHINRLLSLITAYERRYVIFGSAIFKTIFSVMQDRGESIEVMPTVTISGITKNKLSVTPVTIIYNDVEIRACIANSFPSQALPNAYEKMTRYGRFCYEQCFK